MKRPKTELKMASNSPSNFTLKPQRRTKDTHSKSPAAGALKAEAQGSSFSAEELVAWAWAQEVVAWDVVAEFSGVSWGFNGGGVEEEKLLGWLPFGEGDFECVEDGYEWCHDIWELQHINEVPNGGK